MKNDALIWFLLSLALFGVSFGLGNWLLNGNPIIIIGYAASFAFSILSIIVGVKNIKKNYGRKNINVLAVVGAGIITAMYAFFIAVTVIYYLSDLPIKP
jgi:hypothetical protein